MRNGDMVDLSLEALSEFDQVVRTSFSSENEAFNFYNSYALKKGFSVWRCYVERDKRSKKIFKRKFVCSQQGFREMKHMEKKNRKRKARNITRCGCSAKLVVKWSDKIGRWFVLDFEPEHSHNLGTPDSTCFFRSHRGLSDAQKADIAEMEIAGIRKHQIMDILEMQSGGFDKVNCTARDIYNYCYKDKQRTIVAGDAETVISNLKVRQERDPDFFFDYFTDENGHLKGLFWCDAQSRLDYEAFGEVLVFDSTYRTNRYNLPFVPFVGLNHHRSTVIFGCAIISHETAEAYEWILKTFLTTMAQKHPISVITDGDLAMQSAIRNILPTSNHRLCTWHIERNMIKNLHNEKIVEEFRTFLYDCCSISELEVKWEQFIQRNKVSDPNSWLHQMYQMRRLWCALEEEIKDMRKKFKDNNSAPETSTKPFECQQEKVVAADQNTGYTKGGYATNLSGNANPDSKIIDEHGLPSVEKPVSPAFMSASTREDNNMKMKNISETLKQTNERQFFTGETTTEYLLFNDDYILTPDDEEALEFIRHSYPSSTVVEIDNIPLSVEKLHRHISDQWLYGDSIDAYVKISGIESYHKSVLTTYQTQLLIGSHGPFDPQKYPSFAESIAKSCATRDMILVPFNACNSHWTLLVLNYRRTEIQILNSLASTPTYRDDNLETTLVHSLQLCVEYGRDYCQMSPCESDLT